MSSTFAFASFLFLRNWQMQKSLPIQPKTKKKFSKMLQRTTKDKKEKTTVDSFAFHSPLFSADNFADRQMKNNIFIADRHATTTKDRTAGANSGFNKCGLTRVNQVQFFNQPFVSVDSLSLRNPALLKAANRWQQAPKFSLRRHFRGRRLNF